MKNNLSRRDFLKLISLLPLLKINLPTTVSNSEESSQDSDSPNVLILLFDTLSARHVSLYGYHRETTPNLARFAKRATVFHSHYAGGNFTTPGTASILTGTYPWTHRAFHLYGTVGKSIESNNIFSLIGSNKYQRIAYTHNILVAKLLFLFRESIDELTDTRELCLIYDLLSDRLFPSDYNASLTGELQILQGEVGEKQWPSSLFISWIYDTLRRKRKQRVGRDFSHDFPRGLLDYDSYVLFLENTVDWIKTQVRTLPKPYFAYIHLFPPHDPYRPRREFVGIFDDGWTPIQKPAHFLGPGAKEDYLNTQRGMYDETIAYVDSEFGRLYNFMQETNLLNNTYLVFTSDHGEMFERGLRGHATSTLYEPIVHVPLLISKPGQQDRVDVYSPTSCVDLMPTLLHATGHPVPDWCEGEVLPNFGEAEPTSERPIFSVEAKSNPKQAPLTKGTISMVKVQHKLIHYFGYPGYEREFELYNLVDDPEEMENLYSPNSPLASALQHELEEKIQTVNQPFLR